MARKLMLHKLVKEKYGMELKEFLETRYHKEKRSQNDIAKELGCVPASICMWFGKYNIEVLPNGTFNIGRKNTEHQNRRISETHKGKTLSEETRKKLSEARKGQTQIGKHERFQGRKNRADGYIQIYKPEHPFCNSQGYVMEHRLVVEKHIGRLLTKDEEIHHINFDRKDNRIENLHLFANKKSHMKFHMSLRKGKEVELKYEYQ